MSRYYPDASVPAQAGDWLTNTVKRNPEALLLMAAGCVLLMRTGSSSRASNHGTAHLGQSQRGTGNSPSTSDFRQGVSQATSSAKDSAKDYADSAMDYANDVKDRVTDTAKSYADSVSGFADEARRNLSQQTDEWRTQAQSAFDSTRSTLQSTVERILREQPLAVAVAGIAAGAVVASAFPTTDVERKAMGPAVDALSDAADLAKDALTGAAGKAGEKLKEAAEERGLSREGLKDLAGEVVDTFKSSIAEVPAEHSAPTVPDLPASDGKRAEPSASFSSSSQTRKPDDWRTPEKPRSGTGSEMSNRSDR